LYLKLCSCSFGLRTEALPCESPNLAPSALVGGLSRPVGEVFPTTSAEMPPAPGLALFAATFFWKYSTWSVFE